MEDWYPGSPITGDTVNEAVGRGYGVFQFTSGWLEHTGGPEQLDAAIQALLTPDKLLTESGRCLFRRDDAAVQLFFVRPGHYSEEVRGLIEGLTKKIEGESIEGHKCEKSAQS